ncbi:beta strand repeat-containing protein [Nostoc sp.]|uniref:beta strand repeat-containing protein n=1 Tax=Nostoc sp. TaxID=1180 RepID=UPI002FF751F0
MVNRNQSVNKQRKFYQFLVATALLTGSLFQFLAPVLADGTTAGTSISNTATATYEDPNSPGTTINATSNTVVVSVAEVAGITVTASGVTDNNGGNVAVGDLLIYTYTLTNVGNDPTKFHIPNQATTTGPGTVSGTLPNGGIVNSLQYSTDGGQTWINVPQGGVDTPSVPVSGTVLVRVPVTVQAGAQTNDVITVTLGNTPGDAQNQLRSPDGGDIFTVDNPDGSAGEVSGAPVNGTREASATEQIKVGLTVKTYALATILKIRSGYNNAGTSAITDDKLTYDLSLRVESNDPTGQGITPAALTGTSINVDGVASTHILVSDAIPAGTDLAVVPTPPPGWQAVYTTDLVTTDANTANWKTFPLKGADTLAGVTRVGFINNPATITSIAPGTTVNGFSIQLAVESTASSPLTVANIAQLFGQTPTSNFPVYDESGDQNPSNYDGSPGSMTPPTGTDTNGDGVPDTLPPANVDDGYINNPATPETGTDTGNNNSGTGTGGEANVFTVQAPVASALLNGPQNAPDATGPSGLTNDDFTNKSSLVPAGTAPGSTLDPQSVGFTNTIKNSGTDSGVLKIEPTAPTTIGDLPNNTKVTITYGSQSAVYTYNSATGVFTIAGTAITIPNVAPGASINYGVEVDLPPGTQLSTDINRGFPVPITASIDNYTTDTNADGIKDTGNDNIFDSFNITIDRVYTGFLKLLKVSRVLQGTGPVVQGNDGTFSINAKKPAPGNIIEYQIQYTNISDPQSGTGNVILNANKVVITEDGTQSPNNWALDNDTNGQIDTSNIVGSAKDSGSATIQFFSGNPATNSGIDQTGTTTNADVTKYVDTVTDTIAPGIQRTFTFQRKVN